MTIAIARRQRAKASKSLIMQYVDFIATGYCCCLHRAGYSNKLRLSLPPFGHGGIMSQHVARIACLLAALSLTWGMAVDSAAADGPNAKERIVLQVSDDNPKTWNQALNVIQNLQQEFGKENVDVKLVALGYGIGLLKLDSPNGGRVQDAVTSGAQINACEITMRRRKLSRNDMLPNISYVPSGIVEIIRLQKQGWTVIRP